MTRKGLSGAIAELEDSTLPWPCWPVTFLSLVVGRNLLEGALGPGRELGFTHFAAPSALMALDHFVLFYVSLFLSFSVLLSVLARERISRVMKVVTPAWVLVLIPPFLDYLVTSGEGRRITYVLDLSPVILRFFDPTADLERISAGQRVEILAACSLAAVYVGAKTRSWARGLAGFVGIYLLAAVHGVLPSAFAGLTWLATHGTPAPAEAAYEATFTAGGLVLEESRKLALLFLFTSSLLGWLAFAMHAPAKIRALRSDARVLRTLHYVGMTVVGLAVGRALFAAAGVKPSGGGDLLGIAAVVLSTFFAFRASVALNDLFDLEADRIAEPNRPLVTGALERRDATLQIGLFAGGALLLALNVKYATFLVITLALAASFLYSAPPFRLKRIPLVATFWLGVVSLLAALAGFSLFAEERTLTLFPARLGWLLVLSIGLGFGAKDLKDVEGDRAAGTLTLPVVLGGTGGKAAIAVLLVAGYMLVPTLLPYRVLLWPAVVMGAVSAGLVFLWRRPRVDNVLLVLYLAFALAVVLVAVQDVDRLIGRDGQVRTAQASRIKARRAEARGLWTAAGREYLLAAETFDNDAGLLERAGVALFNDGRFQEAERLLARAVALDPTSPISREYLAMAEVNLGQTETARARLCETARMGIRPGIFLAHAGRLDLEEGRAGAARQALAAALRVGEPDVPTRIRLADALSVEGDVDGARSHYETAVRRRPSSAEAWDALGRFYHSMGRTEGALDPLRRAVALDPGEATYWNNLAVALRDLGRTEEALAALDRALSLDARLADAYYNRGVIYAALGHPGKARGQYLLALEIDPGFAPARQALEAVSP